MLISLLFYIVATLLIFSAFAVIIAKNPVHSVLYMILTFFNAAVLFVMLKAEYVAMVLIIVYVGAIAVLFLFVVMMLDIKVSEQRKPFSKIFVLGALIGIILIVEIVLVFNSGLISSSPILDNEVNLNLTNAHGLGYLIYTKYAYIFIVCGLILTVGMIGAVVLTYVRSFENKKQNIKEQNERNGSASVRIISVDREEGI